MAAKKNVTRKKEFEKKILRLCIILNKLNSRLPVTTTELAREFDVNVRSIQRDLKILQDTGFLITRDTRGKYTFEEGFALGKARVNPEEASLLAFLYELTENLGGRFKASFSGMLKKLISDEYDTPFYAKLPQGARLEPSPIVRDLENAIDCYYRIELHYLTADSAVKWFKVDPLKIAYFEGFWYLVARVNGKDWIVKLRLDKIKDVTVTNEEFIPPENLKTMLDQSTNIWFSEKRDKKVVLRVDKAIARFFKQKQYLPLQKITKENQDGSLVVECKVCQFMEARPVILAWLPYIRVIAPRELRDEIGRAVRGYLGNR